MTRHDQKAKERYSELLKQITNDTAINPFETKAEQLARIALAKKDYNYFVNSYFARYATAPCAPFHIKLANDIRNDNRCKYLLGWGRGLAKSTHLDILIPLWLWINNDIKVMVIVGENADKAAILLSDIQAEFEANQLLIHDFGGQKTIGNWADGKFITKNDCAFFSLGVGQSVRGLRHRENRPDYVISDDLDTKEICRNPKRVKQFANWISTDLMGCLNPNRSRYINVNNIFAPLTILTYLRDNKQGYTFNQQNAEDAYGNITWKANTVLTEFYASQKLVMGTLDFNAEYNNSPHVQGEIFTEEMLQYAPLPPLHNFERIVGFWDIAYSKSKTADYNALKIWGLYQGNYYLIKAFVRQCTMEEALNWANDYYGYLKRNNANVIISFYYEAAFWNEAVRMVIELVKNNLSKKGITAINWIKSNVEKGNKYDRMLTMLPFYQQRLIYVAIAERNNNDMQVGIAQLMGIEPSYKTKDDSPDADSQALKKLIEKNTKNNSTYIVQKTVSRKF